MYVWPAAMFTEENDNIHINCKIIIAIIAQQVQIIIVLYVSVSDYKFDLNCPIRIVVISLRFVGNGNNTHIIIIPFKIHHRR